MQHLAEAENKLPVSKYFCVQLCSQKKVAYCQSVCLSDNGDELSLSSAAASPSSENCGSREVKI